MLTCLAITRSYNRLPIVLNFSLRMLRKSFYTKPKIETINIELKTEINAAYQFSLPCIFALYIKFDKSLKIQT